MTMGKDRNMRFTLQFKEGDKRHEKAARYLNSLGHKKSSVIVDALLQYMEGETSDGAPRLPVVSEEQIRRIVYDILKRTGASNTVGSDNINNGRQNKDKNKKAARDTMPAGAAIETMPDVASAPSFSGEQDRSMELDEAALGQISDALKMFGDW